MCGRFAVPMEMSEIVEPFGVRPPALDETPELARPRFNICPTQTVLAIRSGADGDREAVALRWGFIPHWYRAPNDGPLLINARAETIAEKPAFRAACRERRCLIPACGFFEWQGREKGAKTPYYIYPAQGSPFAFAGIWQSWRSPEGEALESCAIVTCAANERLSSIHHRMPVTIAPQDWALWLGEAGHGAAVLMRPAAEDFFAFHPVGSAVNSARSDSSALLEPDGGG